MAVPSRLISGDWTARNKPVGRRDGNYSPAHQLRNLKVLSNEYWVPVENIASLLSCWSPMIEPGFLLPKISSVIHNSGFSGDNVIVIMQIRHQELLRCELFILY